MEISIFEEWRYALLRELNVHKGKVVLCFALTTSLMVLLGLLWRPSFESSAIMFADDSNIIKPLLAGQAEVTRPGAGDQLVATQQTIFSQHILELVAREAKLVPPGDSHSQVPALVIRKLQSGLSIKPAGDNKHIKIAYRDHDPSMAFNVASAVTGVFIRDNARSKREESGQAYSFIDAQVKTYKDQLQAAEERLKDFKSTNLGSSEAAISNRLTELRSRIESLALDLRIARAKRDELRSQMTRENQFISQTYKADVYRSTMASAQARLDTLRLSYQENYPDIVALKQQIEDLRQSAQRSESEPATSDQNSMANPVYQKLRSDVSEADVAAKTLELQLESARHMLESESANSKQSAEYQAQLAELTRDYNVTKQMYEDLLERKERARMSVALDVQGQGLNFRIQAPPEYPDGPVGLHFVHFYLAAPIVGVLVPIALLIAYILLDPRIRFIGLLRENLPSSVQLVTVVPHMSTSMAKRMTRAEWNYLAIFTAVVLAAYVVVAVARLTELI
jgi:polysaccharide chain length determinant protein (PEP-CTERM system associated)